MAGKKQHHVWQMIQRGFGTKTGKDHQIWVFERDGPAKQTVTRKHGVQKHYLSEGDDHSADQILTDFEQSIQSTVQEARLASDGTQVPVDIVAPFISHLEMRSLFLRDEISRVGVFFFEQLTKMLTSPKNAKRFLLKALQENPNMISEKLDEFPLRDADRELAEAAVEHLLPETLNTASLELALFAPAFFNPIVSNMAETAKSSHIKAMQNGFTEIERTASHSKFNFVVSKTDTPIILPDTGVAFLKRKGATPISQKGDRISDIIAPIDETTYLHGFLDNRLARPEKTINLLLASCSYENFIARSPSSDFRKLQPKIGKYAQMLGEREMSQILDEKMKF